MDWFKVNVPVVLPNEIAPVPVVFIFAFAPLKLNVPIDAVPTLIKFVPTTVIFDAIFTSPLVFLAISTAPVLVAELPISKVPPTWLAQNNTEPPLKAPYKYMFDDADVEPTQIQPEEH